jgi:hypothetical protein
MTKTMIPIAARTVMTDMVEASWRVVSDAPPSYGQTPVLPSAPELIRRVDLDSTHRCRTRD